MASNTAHLPQQAAPKLHLVEVSASERRHRRTSFAFASALNIFRCPLFLVGVLNKATSFRRIPLSDPNPPLLRGSRTWPRGFPCQRWGRGSLTGALQDGEQHPQRRNRRQGRLARLSAIQTSALCPFCCFSPGEGFPLKSSASRWFLLEGVSSQKKRSEFRILHFYQNWRVFAGHSLCRHSVFRKGSLRTGRLPLESLLQIVLYFFLLELDIKGRAPLVRVSVSQK